MLFMFISTHSHTPYPNYKFCMPGTDEIYIETNFRENGFRRGPRGISCRADASLQNYEFCMPFRLRLVYE